MNSVHKAFQYIYKMQTVLITGGTGLIGQRLTKHLVKLGYRLIILTRDPDAKESSEKLKYAAWDVKNQTIDTAAIREADIIIHLAGAGVVDHRWTDKYKKEILSSRVDGGRLIIDSLKKIDNKVTTLISSSAIGWYDRDKGDGSVFMESDPPANDFLGTTCQAWEESVEGAAQLGVRVSKIRTGIVLSTDGGALPEFRKPMKFGIAGILGSGKQIISWIHIDDLCRIFIHAMQNQQMSGSYNATAPRPVSNKELTLKLGKMTRGNFIVPMHVPAFALKMIMGESSIEVLKSTTVSSEKIKQSGFTFLYPSIDAALQQLLAPEAKETN